MTGPSHAPIVDALLAAWAAEAKGDYGAAEQIIHDLHTVYGTTEVLAVVAGLTAGPAPTEVRHA